MASLFGNLFKKTGAPASDAGERVVGVDIGKTSIKVVELENRDDVLTLTTYGEIQTGPYSDEPIGQSTSLSAKEEQSALIDLFRESAVEAKSAVFAVPLTTSFVTVMKLPLVEGEDDVSARVQVEARKYIPVPIKDVTLDWAEITTPTQDSKQQEVLLAAIQNDSLDRLRALMKRTNLDKQPTEIECFSVIRAATDSQKETVAILDIGGSSMKLYVARNGLLEQIHRIQTGGSSATQFIADELEIDFAQAELQKRSVGSGGDAATIKKIHQDTFQRPLQECNRFIAEYERMHDLAVEVVVITGGATLFPGMSDFVAKTLDRSVQYAQPFSKVAYPAFMEDVVEEIAPTFTIALGAALRQFE